MLAENSFLETYGFRQHPTYPTYMKEHSLLLTPVCLYGFGDLLRVPETNKPSGYWGLAGSKETHCIEIVVLCALLRISK